MKEALMIKRNGSFIALCVVLMVLSGCGQTGPVKRSWGKMKGLEKVVGNMNNVSYSTGRTQAPRPNALGQPVSMTMFEGAFVWAEYAAPWCTACAWQTPEAMKADKQMDGSIEFLTIMTSKSSSYDDHATVDTATAWASRFGLDPTRVLAAKLWFKTVPEHRFYSPQGHTLFVHVGTLSAVQVTEVISFYKAGYDHWAKTGEAAGWMTFQ